MRIMYDKTTKVITGVIAERVTNFIPPSYSGENGTFINIDYDHKLLKTHKLARLLEKEGNSLIGKTIVIGKGENISFKDKRKKQYQDTVLIDIDNPVLHKDIAIYSKKGMEKGAKVEVEDIESVIFAKIVVEDRTVGTIRLVKKGCCTYVYDTGEVMERDYYPHYVGFNYLIEYLKGKCKWLDMGGLLPKGKDDDLNRFKKKWGKQKLVEVTQ